MSENPSRTRRPQRQRSRLSQTHPAHIGPTESPAPAAPAPERREADPYPEGTDTGRLTIDISRTLRRDLKTWAASQDGTLADVVRAIAKLALSEEDSEARRAVRAAVTTEITARHQRDDMRRRGLL